MMLTPRWSSISSCWKGLFYSVLWVTSLAYKFRFTYMVDQRPLKNFSRSTRAIFLSCADSCFLLQNRMHSRYSRDTWGKFGALNIRVGHWLTTLYKVPHAFQQHYHSRRHPLFVMPSHHRAMASTWGEQKADYPDAATSLTPPEETRRL